MEPGVTGVLMVVALSKALFNFIAEYVHNKYF